MSQHGICPTCEGRGVVGVRVEVVTPNVIGERHDLQPCPDCDGCRRFILDAGGLLGSGLTSVHNDTGAAEPLLRVN